jgi:predicted metal-dependent enzyme (double-stranded beta helix superfamily)
MTAKDWFANDDGRFTVCNVLPLEEKSSRPYRLYRFLTELEDLLENITDDSLRLPVICALTRKLLNSSSWLQSVYLEPNPETGWDVLTLYDELFFPLTLQLVAWEPNRTWPIHNHGCWGLVALLNGQEKNTFWRRSPQPEFPDRIEMVGDCLLAPGDILCLMPDAIHEIEAIGEEPTISFNLYGETDFSQRFEFNPLDRTAKNF